MRRIIKSAVPLGYSPADVRAMVPLDWLLVVRGHSDLAKANAPGANAPSDAELKSLVERYA